MSAAKLVVVLAVALILLSGGLAWAAGPDSRRLEGKLPDGTPVVSIDQPRGTVLDALSAIAKQAGWSLVVTAPESATTRTFTIQVSKRPAGDVLELILEAGSLRASFADGVLRVRSEATAAGSGVSPRVKFSSGTASSAHARSSHSAGCPSRPARQEVVDKAVAIGGSITISGHVRKDVVAVGGSVTLLPSARVEGDVVAIGGTVSGREGHTRRGQRESWRRSRRWSAPVVRGDGRRQAESAFDVRLRRAG
jgi:hypothetical protein